MDYFEKIDHNLYEDLKWNIPEQKQGTINVIGGNGQKFQTEVKVTEYLLANYPIKTVNTILPDALKGQLPPVSGVKFLQSTEVGSFADSVELVETFAMGDYNILLGDLTKNSTTGRAIADACKNSEKPLLITRDTVDLVAENMIDGLLMNENLVFCASTMQLIKILRSVYYPKILLASQSLIQVTEVLHKFTLSYPVGLLTLHGGQVLIARDGKVVALPIEMTGYSPMLFWQGELVAKVAAMNLFNPNNFIKATVAGIA